ncbi:cytochrome P450 [Scleroderma citrinum]
MSAPFPLTVDVVPCPLLHRWLWRIDNHSHWQSSSLLLPILGVAFLVGFALFSKRSSPIARIPVYATLPWPLSRFQFFYDAQQVLYGGYWKHKGGVFRVLRWTGWVIVVSGHQLVEELYRVPEDALSVWEAAKDEIQMLYTFGEPAHSRPYQLTLVKSKLARHRDRLVRDLLDEVIPAVEDIIGTTDWVEFNIKNISRVVTRTFNRMLVGPELCRDESYNQLSTDFTKAVYTTSVIINLFPSVLRGIVGMAITQLPWYQKKGAQFLKPLIEERKAWRGRDDGLEKPNDFLSFLIEGVPEEELDTLDLVARLLTVTTATAHTSSSALTHALLELADRTSYVDPLRQEVAKAVDAHGWTRNGVENMTLVDSFLKESIRTHAIGCMSFPLKAIEPITLSDGTYIPKDSIIATSLAVHFDDEFYENPYTFDGFRFASPATEGGGPSGGNGLSKTSVSFLPFGHGRHIWWPGRYVVAYVLKAVMAHLVLNYDIKLGGDGKAKPDIWFTYYRLPNKDSM